MKRLHLKARDAENLPSLFDFTAPEGAAPEAPATIATPVATVAPAAVTPTPEPAPIPAAPAPAPVQTHVILYTLAKRVERFCENNDIRAILEMAGGYYDGLRISDGSRCGADSKAIASDRLESVSSHSGDCCGRGGWVAGTQLNDGLLVRCERKNEQETFVINVGILDENAEIYTAPVRMNLERQRIGYSSIFAVRSMDLGRWAAPKKAEQNVIFVQTDDELKQILREKKPWILPWLNEKNYELRAWLAAPWLETLDKAGYHFVRTFLIKQTLRWEDNTRYQHLNLLVQPGTKPKDIFKTIKAVYTALKEEVCLQTWDVYRRMCKTGKIGQDTVKQVYDAGYTTKDLEYVSTILGVKYNDRNVFTWTSLINYLGRIDMYEAIDRREGLPILADYLSMCRQLEMEPRTDGDSLKREHDIAARLIREQRNEQQAQRMREAEERLRREIAEGAPKKGRLTYAEQVYTVKPITDYDTLIDEARQQHNCVASYADRIAKGTSVICTMRETAHPEHSLVTIELSPDLRTIRQKFLAYNQPIRSKAISDFIDRWMHQIHAEETVAGIPDDLEDFDELSAEAAAAA